jgi:hypothetical protein
MTASKTEHTKGQLQVLITDSEAMKGANCVLISDNGDQIARCMAPFPFDTSWNERDANAHRLALAWNCHDELLEACESMISAAMFGDEDEMDAAVRAAHEVVAKVTGSQS